MVYKLYLNKSALKKKSTAKLNAWLHTLELAHFPKLLSPKGLNKTSTEPRDGEKQRKSKMKSYFELFDFGRSLCIYVLTQMSVLLRTHFKQNFKTILWSPYSEIAEMLDSLSWPISHSLCSRLHAETWEV